MSDGAPTLEVGFAINGGASFQELQRLQEAMDSTEGRMIRQAAEIERATGGMLNLGGATAQMRAFGIESERSAQATAREFARVEKAGEGLIRSLERQNAAYGLTRSELRQMRVEELALSADRLGNSDLATRLRNEQISLASKEAATVAASAEKQVSAMRGINSSLAERAQLEAALERFTGVNRVRATDAGATYSALAERERALQLIEQQTAAEREQLLVQRQQINLLGERARLEAALERGTGVGRTRATDAGATYSALAARAAEQEATALRQAAHAYDMFEAAARRGAAAQREHEAAADRDAVALARLRAIIDPSAAARQRLNAELAEARRLMTAAGASAHELAAAEDALHARANRATQQYDAMAGGARRSGFALQTIALQLPDITQGLLTGQKPMTVFIQQGFQIVQVAQMAQGGLRGFGREVAGLAVRFAPLLVGLAAAGAGFALFNRWVNQGVTNDQLTKDLGKITGGADATKQELFKLKDASITWGDTSKALFSEIGKDIASIFLNDMKGMGNDVKGVLDDMASYGRTALAGLYAGVAGTKAYMAEASTREGLVNIVTGDPTVIDRTYGEAFRKADKYLSDLGDRVKKQALANARTRLAESIGYNPTPRPKTDRHAEQLEREARAVEALIRNQYMLSDAYGVSGAAALIAEARIKAESQAIRRRGDIEEAVARQIRLAVAERASSAAKATAAMREQALIQEQVNAAVSNGLTPAALAADMVRDRMQDLPVLAAIEAAARTNDLAGIAANTRALTDMRAARDRLTESERQARLLASIEAGGDQLAEMRLEMSMIGQLDMVRARALARLKAEQEMRRANRSGPLADDYVNQQGNLAVEAVRLAQMQYEYNASLTATADLWDVIARNVQNAGRGMADAFGEAGRALGDVASIYATYRAQQEQAELRRRQEIASGADIERTNARFAIANSTAQIGMLGDMTNAARGFFDEKSKGYAALANAEKAFRAIEFAMSVRAMAQDAAETVSSVAKSGVRAAAHGVEAVARAIASLPFPANLAAGAATAAALTAIGVSIAGGFGGNGRKSEPANEGRGTVLGNPEAQSESVKRAIDQLREVDLLMLGHSREMAASLRSIDSQIGGVAALIVRSGDVNASAGVAEGFRPNLIGSVLGNVPIIGGLLSGLFGSKTTVTASGLFGGPQSLGNILSGGFDASYYSDIEKQKRFLGIKTGTSRSTQFTGADAGLENQFTMILRSFNDAIAATAGPLGMTTDDIQRRLNGFVVNIGKIDLKGLTGEQVQERLSAVFGAAADNMAAAAVPGLQRFQKIGEGAFETLVRVSSTVEAVSYALGQLGGSARILGIDAKMGLADQFESLSAMNSAVGAYFERFYTTEEQTAARTAQLTDVFRSLGMVMPTSLTAFRQLVDAQNLNTEAGRAAYATLLQLAPAFADLKEQMEGAKSAADILAEREGLERKLLELNGNTAAIRALDLARLDASNRALQQQIWAIEDAQEAARAAQQLREAWTSVGDSIMEEVKRIRGLDTVGGTSFASLMGQFNAATAAARGGDIDAARSLPQLSQALLASAAEAATSRQELARVQAQTAASLEATNAVIEALSGNAPVAKTDEAILAAIGTMTAANNAAAASNDGSAAELRAIRAEVAQLRTENMAGHATTASNTGKIARKMDDVTAASGGDAISVQAA